MLGICKDRATSFIREVDQFGAVFRPSIKLKDSQYKTFFGGLFSIIIYGTSLAYFIYGIYQWQTGQMLPNIVIDEQKIESIYFFTGTEKIFLFEPKLSKGQLHPFNKSQIVMMALLHQFLDGEATGNFSRVDIENDGSLQVNNLELAFNYPINGGIANKDQEYYIVLTSCQEDLLHTDEKCANNDVIQQFWQQDNFMSLELNTQQFDTQTRKLNNISRQFYVIYNSLQTYYNQMYICTTQSVLDQGLLFPSTTQLHYVSDVEMNSQSIDIKGFSAQFGIPIYMVFDIEIDSVKILQFISYPNIGSVLATIGSIVSLILFLSFIAVMINQKKLEEEAVKDVISLYFPQINDFVIKKNWRGQITEIKCKEQKYNVKQYVQYYQKLSEVAQQKLCFLNQIYEMSRLQFALQKLLDKNELVELRDISLQLQIRPLEDQKVKQQDHSEPYDEQNNISVAQDESCQVDGYQTKSYQVETKLEIIDISNEHQKATIENIKQDSNRIQNQTNLQIIQQEQSDEFEESDFDLFCLNRINRIL